MTGWKIALLLLMFLRTINAVLNIGKVRPIDSPETGTWNVVGWFLVTALAVLA